MSMSRSTSGSATENDNGMSSRQRPPKSSATGRPDAWPTMSNNAISIAAFASGWATTAWAPGPGVPAPRHQFLDAVRIGADQQRPEIDVQRRDIGLDGAGEHRPRGCVAPAGDAGVGLELQDGVLDRARAVARAVPTHQAHRYVGDEHRHRRDLDLLQKTASPLSPLQSIAHYACQPQRGNAMRRNLLRERLNAGKPTVGTHILSAWPTLVELIGHSKQYDYVEFTAEYAPFDLHDLDNLGRAFELSGMSGMIKIEQTQYTHQAMRAIGAGFQRDR